jgi:molecular chaperone GrpE
MDKEKDSDCSLSENNYEDSESPSPSVNNDISDEDILNELKNTKNELKNTKNELKNTKNELEHYRSLYSDTFNKLKYGLADFDNYRKNVEKQNSLKILSIKADVFSVVVNIREDFVRAIDTIKQKKIDNAILEGLESILKNINIFLEKEGIKEIDSLNNSFDPNLHEIVGLNDRVLRPSLVEVSKKIVKNIDNNNNRQGDEI